MATKEITVTELAEALGTDPRTTRKLLRKVTPKENQPGKGGRWAITPALVKSTRKAFDEMQATAEVEDASTED